MWKRLSSHFPRLNITPGSSPPPWYYGRWHSSPFSEETGGAGGQAQCAATPRCRSFLLTLLLCSSVGPPWATVPLGTYLLSPGAPSLPLTLLLPRSISSQKPPLQPLHFQNFATATQHNYFVTKNVHAVYSNALNSSLLSCFHFFSIWQRQNPLVS